MAARALLFAAALAGCDSPTPRTAAPADAARVAMDAASASYAACVDKAARAIDVSNDSAGALAGLAAKSCAAERAAVVERIVAFQRAGSPNEAAEVSATVAERSVRTADSDLRTRATATIVGRQLKEKKAT